MKAKNIILQIILVGIVIIGYSQGKVENNDSYLKGSADSYFKFSGSGDMTLIGTNADRTIFGNLEADFSGTGNYKLTIPVSSFITVDGNLTLNDTLLLEASSNGMTSLITNGSVTGNYSEVQQHIPSYNEWHIVSSPVDSEVSGVYAGIFLLDWSEPDSLWSFINSIIEPLNPTEGFFVWADSSYSSPRDVSFTGLLNTGDQFVSNLTFNNNEEEGHGWNLIGNPYPSAVEWDNTWPLSGIDATIYVYDGIQYFIWNYNFGGYGTKGNGYIPSTQGFWVKANSENPTLTIPNNKRIHNSQAFYKNSDPLQNMICIEIIGNAFIDRAIIGMVDDATSEFDSEYDAYKIYGIEKAPQIFTYCQDLKMAANLFPFIEDSKVVKLGIKTGTEGQCILSFSGLEFFDNSIDIYLEDKFISENNESFNNLRENPDYSFTTVAGIEPNRFVLHFNNNHSNIYDNPTDGANSNAIKIYSYEKKIYVNYLDNAKARMNVYNMLGREIISKNLVSFQLNSLHLNERGYYIVKVISHKMIKTKKVYIN